MLSFDEVLIQVLISLRKTLRHTDKAHLQELKPFYETTDNTSLSANPLENTIIRFYISDYHNYYNSYSNILQRNSPYSAIFKDFLSKKELPHFWESSSYFKILILFSTLLNLV